MDVSNSARRDESLTEIQEEYARRTERWNQRDEGRRRLDQTLLERTLADYGKMLARAGLLPLGERSVLDFGSGRNEFLVACRERWGQTGSMLGGVELMPDRVERGLADYPYLTLTCGSADKLDYPDASFDLVHQGMLLSSVLDEALRRAIRDEMDRVLRPGGYVLWYDFVWNPTNPHARGIPWREVRDYFAGWQVVDRRRVTVAPPLARIAARLWEPLVGLLESCRVLNLWQLALLRKP